MSYTKDDAVMTKGLAILAMLSLHLFFREGASVLGHPVFWFNDTVPVVSWIGFFSEYCVTLYSICAGYAYYLLYKKGKNTIKDRIRRILRLMSTYWIVLCLFSILGFFVEPQGRVPGSIVLFLQNAVLYKSYCGAWWYLHSYVFMMLLPSGVIILLARNLSIGKGLFVCLIVQVGWYLIGKFHLIPFEFHNSSLVLYIITEIKNLIAIMPGVWAGTLLCKDEIICKLDRYLTIRLNGRRNLLFIISWVVCFFAFNILHKAVLVGMLGIWIFVSFNLYSKTNKIKKVFLFLGAHSTNIWLTHMFFYACVFTRLVEKVRYPAFMLIFLLALCILSSYVIELIRIAIIRIRKMVL